jgi:hypothetical protein
MSQGCMYSEQVYCIAVGVDRMEGKVTAVVAGVAGVDLD